MNEYPRVKVTAPGYESFEGWLIGTLSRLDGTPMSIVGFEWAGKFDFELFQSKYVEILSQ